MFHAKVNESMKHTNKKLESADSIVIAGSAIISAVVAVDNIPTVHPEMWIQCMDCFKLCAHEKCTDRSLKFVR
jgi:hypothetical protein